MPSKLNTWIQSTSFGEKTLLDRATITNYKNFGLVHILVISGFHFSFISIILSKIILLPFIIFYIFRKIKPNHWININLACNIAVCVFLIFYAELIQYSTSCQRALLTRIVGTITPIFFGNFCKSKQIILSFLLQSFFFPSDVFSSSSLLSWSCYIVVIAHFDHSKLDSSFLSKIINHLEMQSVLTLISATFTKSFTLLSLLSNLILSPCYPILTFMNLISLVLIETDTLISLNKIIMDLQIMIIDLPKMLGNYFLLIKSKFFEINIPAGSASFLMLQIIFFYFFLECLKNIFTFNKITGRQNRS